MDKKFIITLVSHCEKIWWDSGYDALIIAVEAILKLQDRISGRTGKKVSSTFCTFVEHENSGRVNIDISNVPELFKKARALGNEIGLHLHGPPNQLDQGIQDRLIVSDAKLITNAGIIPPRTYTAGDFITSSDLVGILESAEFEVDCSVIPQIGRRNVDGAIVDYTLRTDLRPYYLSHENICKDITSTMKPGEKIAP